MLEKLNSHKQINEVITVPHTIYKIKWLKDLNTRHHKTPRRKHAKTFSDMNQNNVFLVQSPKAIEIKAKINKWDLIELISFRPEKKKKKKHKMKIQPTDW